jgi:iron complex outermembrane receptor protein
VNIVDSNGLMYAVMEIMFPSYAANVAAGVVDLYRDSISLGGLALAQSLGRNLGESNGKAEGTDTQTTEDSLKISIDLDNGYTLSSVTGASGYEYEDDIDTDFLPVKFIGRSDISDYDQTNQEFRLSSPTDGALSWMMIFASADYNFTDSYKMTGDHDPIDFQKAFGKINLRASLRSES